MNNLKEDEISEVSIITPLHNAEAYISQTIGSVLHQTYQKWELIIVDDVSEDDSVQIVENFSKNDARIKLIRLRENSGAAVARNTAIETAKGRYIAFLDSDDVWLPEKLERQLTFMQENNYPFSFSAYERIDENGRSLGTVGVPKKVNYKQMLKTSVIGCLTAMYDTSHFGKVYMPLIRKRQDYGLWLKLLKQTDFAHGLQTSLGKYRIRRDSISANKMNTATYNWRLYRQVEKLSFLASCYYFSHYAVRGLLRTKFPTFAKKLGVMQ
ncbi:glycosyltransferase family 2 protein [Methylophaga thiooxydans]|uniref:Glycosyl transferase, group 2 family protein n=1 Tax=Methylophaga thiooxydans DMS010 TaxID=637616 RepID=C0N9X1_9GAMM|nr:glycosyltransferase family 2 protein [Methylophaga thiooxydans]EEF78466.1 glycosyl transferase, group 2 family protein [Methylophaga thiooxydans DMS010]